MQIEVGFPIKSFRFTSGAVEEFKNTFNLSAGTVGTLESKIVITNILSNDDKSNLILSYTEDFNPEEGLKYFFERAEKYAYDYLSTLVKSTATHRIAALD